MQLLAEPVNHLKLRLDHQFVGKVYLRNGSEESTSSYVEANFQASYTIDAEYQDIVFNLGLNNIYNAVYSSNIRINASNGRYYEPAPPFNFWAGIQFVW
ncbi:MAG: TonB-dependent receptor [Saprospiraceae bacterium]|nr:TonB-dependent receptor [Saprospiraceae bacterium]